MKKTLTFTIVLLLLTGCATQKAYEGERRSSDELSAISPPFPSPLAIREVDGNRLDKMKSGAFETLPGKHTIKVSVDLGPQPITGWHKMTPPVEMIFDTEAGKKYIVDFNRREGSKWLYFVIEERSGKVIYEIEK